MSDYSLYKLAAMDERPGLSYMPGVGGYRVVRKFMATHKGQPVCVRGR